MTDYKQYTFLVFLFLSIVTYSQNSIYQNHSYRPFDRYVYNSDVRFHTAIKPYSMQDVNKVVSLDTLFVVQTQNKWADKVLNQSLITKDIEEFTFTIRPACNFEISKQVGDTVGAWINTRGVILEASVKNKIFIKSSFYETQSNFKDYRYDRILELNRRVPGQGVAKWFGKNNDGFDYAISEAYISYIPSKYFDFELGNGKHFIGDGYRSLILSDNAFSYPYFKLTANVGHVKYISMWSQHQYIDNPHVGNSRYPKKWNVLHYLDWSVTKWLNIGLFETIVWADEDSINGKRGFEFNYANPVIFMRPTEFSIGSPDNVLMGATGKITFLKKHVLYGQIIIDEFNVTEFKKKSAWWGTKYAVQAGYKTYDIAGIKNLDVQTEINYARPFIYSHFTEGQNYGHNLQPLAHPRGSNFYESVSFLRYSYKRWFVEAKFLYLVHGQDSSAASFGNDIFKLYTTRTQEYGHKTAESNIQNTVVYKDFKVSYMINPHNNMNITFGITDRNQISDIVDKKQLMYYIGFRTTLNNYYYDF